MRCLLEIIFTKEKDMKTQTSTLTGPALDWAVAKCQSDTHLTHPANWRLFLISHRRNQHTFSTDWAQGGPIIEREKISTDYALCYGETGQEWEAVSVDDLKVGGPTPLIAACRCYVASKLGDTVEIPDELL